MLVCIYCRKIKNIISQVVLNLCFILLSISSSLCAQQFTSPSLEVGFPLIQKYTTKDYKAFAQNWAFTQAPNGFIYVGNNDGVLEYDGVNWTLIPIRKSTVVRSLDVDPNTGRIYVGVIGDFGFLEKDSKGEFHFVSLKLRLPESDRQFADVWNTFYTPDGVYFFTQQKLFFVKEDKITHWESNSSFHRSFMVGKRIFVRERDKGLLELIEGKLQLVKNGDVFANEGISFIVDWPIAGEGKLLLGSTKRGPLLYDGISFDEWSISTKENLETTYTALRLKDGRLVIGTLQFGILIYSGNGELLTQINRESGLPDNAVYALKSDYEGGLWVASDRGIARLEINNPLTLFDERTGLKGQVIKTIRFQKSLYSATSNGLFKFNVDNNNFEQINEIQNLTFDLLSFKERLIIANHQGVFQLKNNIITRLLDHDTETAFTLTKRKNRDNQIIVGDRQGVAVLEFDNNQWQEFRLPSIHFEVREVLMTSELILWIATNNNGVIRVTFPTAWPNSGPPTIEKYDQSNGLPSLSGIKLLLINDEIRFSTDNGILLFDEENDQFVIDSFFTDLSEREKFNISQIKQLSDDKYWAVALKEENNTLNSYVGLIINKLGDLTWSNRYFSALNGQRVNSVYFDINDTLWLGNETGLYHYNINSPESNEPPYQVHLRQVSDEKGHVIYNGIKAVKHPILNIEQNTLRFDFSASSFNTPEKTKYQVKLTGFEDAWSTWDNKTTATYQNLWEGTYTFQVRAKNRNGTISESNNFTFEILPPWYRSFILYFLLMVSALFLYIRIKGHKNIEILNVDKEQEKDINKEEYELTEIESETQPNSNNENPSLKRLKLQIGAKIWLVPIEDIVCILAYGRYVKIITPHREGLIRMPLKNLFQKLDADNFWQIHRSTIININYLDYVGNAVSERMTVNMIGIKDPLQISKSYSSQFRSGN
jgi:hypothetical protein